MTAREWARITAGCLFVAAVLNALASLGYFAGGIFAKLIVGWNVDLWFDLLAESGSVDPERAAEHRETVESVSQHVGSLLLYWAAVLALSAPLLVAGAIQALRLRSSLLISAAGYSAMVLEMISIVITGIGFLHLPGLAAGPLAFLTARAMREAQRETPAEAGVMDKDRFDQLR